MNRPAMTSFRNIAAACAILIAAPLTGCNMSEEEPLEGPLRGSDIGGDFTLVGSDGNPVSWDDFAGQFRIVYFGYTYCPDVCPVDAQAIGRGLSLLEEQNPALEGKVTPLFITVDPERDTPEVVGQFARAFHPRMVGLTGSRDAIDDAAGKFAVFHDAGEPDPNGDYLVGHSNQAMLFGPEGEPISLLPTDVGGQAVADELKKWVR